METVLQALLTSLEDPLASDQDVTLVLNLGMLGAAIGTGGGGNWEGGGGGRLLVGEECQNGGNSGAALGGSAVSSVRIRLVKGSKGRERER